MRILHVAESVKGGCGTYLNQVLRAQLCDPAIEHVHAVLPDAHVVQVPDIPDANRTLFASTGRSPASLHALWRATAQEVRQFRPDCVHLHSTFAGAIGRVGLALGRHRPAVVYCAHGWAFDMAGSRIKQSAMALAERVLARSCEGVIAISEYERRRGISAGIAPDRIVTVLNGIADLPGSCAGGWRSRSRVVGDRPPRRLLFIGRLDRQKGIDVLLAAIAGLEDRIALRVIGSAVVGDQSAPDLPRAGLTVLGWCDEQRIRQELEWADCVVVPSRWEGFGLVALEAMRSARAVIAANVGGLPEVVEAGRTGWLVPPEDPAALRAALLSLTDAQLAAAGAAGRQRFLQRFTIERTAVALTAVYRQAIAMRSSISHAFASA
jgi:glycosyltransferase involved in cell wall biosynthesis